MRFREEEHRSPNAAAEPRHEQRGVCFHHSVLPFDAALTRLLDPASQVSYHVLIRADGLRARLVPDEAIAWHAGVSTFRGRTHCNLFLLGVSFAGDTYREPLTEEQIDSALEWLRLRWARHGWSLDWMTDHRHIAPSRKDDLNPIEWQRLAAAIAAEFG